MAANENEIGFRLYTPNPRNGQGPSGNKGSNKASMSSQGRLNGLNESITQAIEEEDATASTSSQAGGNTTVIATRSPR